jgi:dienelactone hydrolase
VQFLQSQVNDGKKIILIGYSKGAPDIFETLAMNPNLAKRVAFCFGGGRARWIAVRWRVAGTGRQVDQAIHD